MDVAGHIVIYGGSFNPPHMGHQMACLYLLEALDAEAVWLVPAFEHPFGKDLAPYGHRLEMCRRLASPFGGRVLASDVERELEAGGRTYDTLTHLIAHHPGQRFALAVGSDILSETEQWHRWKDITSLVPVVVMRRGGFPADNTDANAIELPEVSSSTVRGRLGRGETVSGMVPESVAAYIAQERLFGA